MARRSGDLVKSPVLPVTLKIRMDAAGRSFDWTQARLRVITGWSIWLGSSRVSRCCAAGHRGYNCLCSASVQTTTAKDSCRNVHSLVSPDVERELLHPLGCPDRLKVGCDSWPQLAAPRRCVAVCGTPPGRSVGRSAEECPAPRAAARLRTRRSMGHHSTKQLNQ